MIRRIRRAIGFARHMPPGKLWARARLTVQRRLSLKRAPSLGGAIPVVASPPQPVFAPRTGRIERTEAGWAFTFVGRRCVAGDPVDWTTPGMTPRDQLWRMNLHYMEYLEELAVEPGLDLIRQWIAANPPWQPGYWHDSWNSYALSLRVMCWMQFLARHGQTGQHADIDTSLAQQMRFLARNLELDLGGNHLMKNIKALLWASAWFDGAEARGWRRTGLALLHRELAVQLLGDGTHYERSPSYHAQVLADLIECRAALGDAAPAALVAAIPAMAQAAVDLSHADGSPALFNDAGLTMAYPPEQCAVAAGCGVVRRTVFGYREAGYFGAHFDDWSIIADMGRIGPDDLPAHAHGDVGGFELSVGGLAFIVDQGVYEYVDGDRRRRSRSAAAHSVLAMDGIDQAEFFGAFRCGKRPQVTVDRWQEGVSGFVLSGWHDGYRRTAGDAIVTRRFDVDGDGVRITDALSGPSQRACRVGLLLHPDCEIEQRAGVVEIVRAGKMIRVETAMTISVRKECWWPDMGVEVPAKRLYLDWTGDMVESSFTISIGSRKRVGHS